MHHGTTQITPIRCKIKSAESSCLSDWGGFSFQRIHHTATILMDGMFFNTSLHLLYCSLRWQYGFNIPSCVSAGKRVEKDSTHTLLWKSKVTLQVRALQWKQLIWRLCQVINWRFTLQYLLNAKEMAYNMTLLSFLGGKKVVRQLLAYFEFGPSDIERLELR